MSLSHYLQTVTPSNDAATLAPPPRFTPGPWSVGELDEPTGQINIMAGERYVLAALPGLDAQAANAQLAAQAPRMLEQLQALQVLVARGVSAGTISPNAIPLSLLRAVAATLQDATDPPS